MMAAMSIALKSVMSVTNVTRCTMNTSPGAVPSFTSSSLVARPSPPVGECPCARSARSLHFARRCFLCLAAAQPSPPSATLPWARAHTGRAASPGGDLKVADKVPSIPQQAGRHFDRLCSLNLHARVRCLLLYPLEECLDLLGNVKQFVARLALLWMVVVVLLLHACATFDRGDWLRRSVCRDRPYQGTGLLMRDTRRFVSVALPLREG